MKEITIIWIDRKGAKIITTTPNELISTTEVDSGEPELPPMGMTPEFRKNRIKARNEFFKTITSIIEKAREIVLFGPDNTKEEYLDYLSDNSKIIFSKIIGVESSQDLSEEKIIARGRKYI